MPAGHGRENRSPTIPKRAHGRQVTAGAHAGVRGSCLPVNALRPPALIVLLPSGLARHGIALCSNHPGHCRCSQRSQQLRTASELSPACPGALSETHHHRRVRCAWATRLPGCLRLGEPLPTSRRRCESGAGAAECDIVRRRRDHHQAHPSLGRSVRARLIDPRPWHVAVEPCGRTGRDPAYRARRSGRRTLSRFYFAAVYLTARWKLKLASLHRNVYVANGLVAALTVFQCRAARRRPPLPAATVIVRFCVSSRPRSSARSSIEDPSCGRPRHQGSGFDADGTRLRRLCASTTMYARRRARRATVRFRGVLDGEPRQLHRDDVAVCATLPRLGESDPRAAAAARSSTWVPVASVAPADAVPRSLVTRAFVEKPATSVHACSNRSARGRAISRP